MAEFTEYIDPNDVQLTLNDFPLYGTDSYGVHWYTTFQQISGLFDGVASTLETDNKTWSDGYYSNVPTREGRTITVDGLIYGACPEDLVKSWSDFKGKLALDDQTLFIKMGSIERQVTVKQSKSAPLVQWNGLTCLKWSISLTALSSYLYAAGDPTSGSTALPTTDGGFTFPEEGYTFEGDRKQSDWYFSESVVSGSISLTNDGTAPSPITARIDGPVFNPAITHSPSGRVMSFNIGLGTGNFLLINGETKEILLNGTAPLKGQVPRREWSYAEPGENTWSFSANDYNPNAKLTISFRGAYL